MTVEVLPAAKVPPPRAVDQATLRTVVFSSALDGRHVVGRTSLWFESRDRGQVKDDLDLVYTIVVPPFVVGSSMTVDAGRLIQVNKEVGSSGKSAISRFNYRVLLCPIA